VRGYRLVSAPNYDWNKQQVAEQQQQYLLQLLRQAHVISTTG
jgi:hypothetical protein